MNYRSWLLVPGDSENKLADAAGSGADAIVVDLGDPLLADSQPAARLLAAQWLQAHRRQIIEQRSAARWVRINGLDSRSWRDDLVAVMAAAPDGIILPCADGPEAVRQLAAEIYELEQRNHLTNGSTRIIAMVGESAKSAMTIAAYLDSQHQRLAGLGWSAAALAGAIGAARTSDGPPVACDTFAFVRAQALLTAHGCGVMAIDTLRAEPASRKGFDQAARQSRAEGFTGMLANCADQVAAINDAFTPAADEPAQAATGLRAGTGLEAPRGPILRPA